MSYHCHRKYIRARPRRGLPRAPSPERRAPSPEPRAPSPEPRGGAAPARGRAAITNNNSAAQQRDDERAELANQLQDEEATLIGIRINATHKDSLVVVFIACTQKARSFTTKDCTYDSCTCFRVSLWGWYSPCVVDERSSVRRVPSAGLQPHADIEIANTGHRTALRGLRSALSYCDCTGDKRATDRFTPLSDVTGH